MSFDQSRSAQKRALLRDMVDELPAAYMRRISDADDRDTARLLADCRRQPTPARLNALATHLLPHVTRWLIHKYTRSGSEILPPEEMLQYAAVGMLEGLRRIVRANITTPAELYRFTIGCASKGMIHGIRLWKWGGDVSVRKMILKRIRRLYVREHGRLPTPDEVEAQLATIVVNPNIQIGDTPPTGLNAPSRYDRGRQLKSFADDQDAELAASEAIARGEEPDARAINADVLRLAMKGLSADQQRILTSVLAGNGPTEIAKMLGVSRLAAKRRMNAVLWQARTRADLARALGVERQYRPPASMDRNGNFKSVTSFPPARLVG